MEGSQPVSAAEAATASAAPLRQAVLAGGFLGRAGAAAADALASFLVERPGSALRMWFGDAGIAALLAHDGTRRGRAEGFQRLEEAVDRDLATIDRMVSEQLDATLRQDRLRRLEGSWRGLHWLAGRLPAGNRCKVKLLSLRWSEACRDFERAVEFDQSQLFRKIYEDEFGTPGGEPYGLLCGDWELRPFPGPGSSTDDVAGLDALSGIAAAAFSPTVVAAHPVLFGLDTWQELGPAIDPTEPMRGPDRRRWRSMQEREDTRFLGVLLPRALARPPWPDDGARADRFRYRPDLGQPGARAWMSAVYPLAAVTIRAFATYGWPADIRGAMVGHTAAGGVVDGLPQERFASDPPGAPGRPPVEVSLTDEQERQVVEAGLMPLIGLEGLPEAAFAAAPSLHRPPRMTGDGANANQRLSAQFNAVLCVSRFAHCVKMLGRDMVGSFKTPQDIERKLQTWLMQYTSATSGAVGESGARQPLRSSKVEVREKPGQPGVFGCTILMQPHFQLDEVGAAFRLVTDLSAPRAAA
ncbi:MAG: type secretion system family protein [Belnapia sp.]|nr:type secretion system family protein [Belnapia sp.]